MAGSSTFAVLSLDHPCTNVDALKDHTIAFSGLKDGRHAFHFDLDNSFFEAAHEEEYLGGQVAVEVTMDKSTHLIVTVIHVNGAVRLHCDHCNGLMDQPVEGEQRQIFQMTGESDVEDEELVSLDEQAHEINLTHYFFECISLHLPQRRVHPEGHCDPEVDAVLGHLGQPEEEPMDHQDPRWAALQELKNKDR